MKRLYTDIDPFCCEVLRARVADGGLPPGEVWERDIKTITADELRPFTQIHLFCGIGGSPLGLKWAGWPDDRSIVTAGFPCQDISNAGTRDGLDGERSGLYSESIRIVRCLRPRHFLMENSAALTLRGLDRVLGDLAQSGYDAEWDCLPASAFGAKHERDRVWIVAHAASNGLEALSTKAGILMEAAIPRNGGFARAEGGESMVFSEPAYRQMVAEPNILGVTYGLPNRVHRLKGLGNAIVPQIAEWLGRQIMSSEQA